MKMSKEARELRNAQARAWRKANPDKVREINVRYWEKKAKEAINSERAGHGDADGGKSEG